MSKKDIKIIVINKPSKEEASKKIKDLIKFLEDTWYLPLKTESYK